jgi:hypothetical protein
LLAPAAPVNVTPTSGAQPLVGLAEICEKITPRPKKNIAHNKRRTRFDIAALKAFCLKTNLFFFDMAANFFVSLFTLL